MVLIRLVKCPQLVEGAFLLSYSFWLVNKVIIIIIIIIIIITKQPQVQYEYLFR